MATFLKIVSTIYLVVLWLPFALTVTGVRMDVAGTKIDGAVLVLAFIVCLALTIPAVALFAFAQIVEDVRALRRYQHLSLKHLEVMRSYYEPSQR